MAGGADIRAGRAFVELFLKNSFTRDLTRTLAGARRQLNEFAGSVGSLGQQLATVGAAGLLPFGAAAKTFADFDDEMRQVGAVSQATGDELARLTEKAKALGASTSFTAVEVAGLMAELGRAGFSPRQVEDMTAAVLDLARASKTDAVVSSGIMAATIRQFGLEAADATRVADALTLTANATFNSVEQLGEALKYAGPVARDLGMSMEQTLAVLGGLGNVGIQGEMAGTALRRLGILAATEGEKIKSAFNVDATDAAGNLRPMVDVLREIVVAANALPTGERIKILDDIFGKQGITGAGAVGRAGVDIKGLEDRLTGARSAAEKADAAVESLGQSAASAGGIDLSAWWRDGGSDASQQRPVGPVATATPQPSENGVAGTAARTAAQMDAGLGGSLRILTSAVEGAAIAVGEALAPALKSVVETATGAATGLIEFVKSNQETVVTVVKVLAAVAAGGAAFMAMGLGASFLATAIGGFLSIASMAVSVIGVVVGAVAALASPIGIAVVAIGGIVAALLTCTDAGRGVVVIFGEIAKSIGDQLGKAVAFAREAFGEIAKSIAAGDISRAATIAMAALNLAFATGLNAAHDLFIDFKYAAIEAVADIAKPLLKLLGAMESVAIGDVKQQIKIGIGQLSFALDDFSPESRRRNEINDRKSFNPQLDAARADYANAIKSPTAKERDEKRKKFEPYVPDMSVDGKRPPVQATGGNKPTPPTSAVSVAVTGAAFAAIAGARGGAQTRAITIAEQQRELARQQLAQQKAMAQALKDFNNVGP